MQQKRVMAATAVGHQHAAALMGLMENLLGSMPQCRVDKARRHMRSAMWLWHGVQRCSCAGCCSAPLTLSKSPSLRTPRMASSSSAFLLRCTPPVQPITRHMPCCVSPNPTAPHTTPANLASALNDPSLVKSQLSEPVQTLRPFMRLTG